MTLTRDGRQGRLMRCGEIAFAGTPRTDRMPGRCQWQVPSGKEFQYTAARAGDRTLLAGTGGAPEAGRDHPPDEARLPGRLVQLVVARQRLEALGLAPAPGKLADARPAD